ncbi:phage recombination protein Bet [Vibrio parahaemolyticus]|nr:phage recombination protein Bet [Vibrio parahaemolyticus]
MSHQSSAKANNVSTLPQSNQPSLIESMATKFGVEPNKFWDALKATAFKQRNGDAPNNEQMMALLVVANEYNLNPFTKEIYAFPDTQSKGIIPVVGVDGWSRIINSHAQFDGMEFRFSETTITVKGLTQPIFEWIECIMYRKDRERPTIIREYMDEIYREPFEKNGYVTKGPWQTHPRRMARHKVIIQTARVALGYTGIYDEDEAERIISVQAREVSSQPPIEFSAEQPQATIAPPSEKPEIMQQLAQVSHVQDAEFEEIQTVQEEQSVSAVQHEKPSQDTKPMAREVFNTQFGEVSAKDAKMISNMVEFAVSSGAWDTTKDSFKERYEGHVLEFALSEINIAFNEAMKDFE